jgi:hypothetical protein
LPTGARRSCFKEKKQRWKIWWHCPFKRPLN